MSVEHREAKATEYSRAPRGVGAAMCPVRSGEPRPPRVPEMEILGVTAAAETRLQERGQSARTLTVDDSMIDLACQQLGQEFDALVRGALIVAAGPHPAGVHRLRTSTRRIRAALRLFDRLFPSRRVRKFRREFRWLAQVLGEVRDLDVFCEDLGRHVAEMAPEDAERLALYRPYLDHEYADARAQLVSAFGSDRYAQLLATFGSFLEAASSPAALCHRGELTIADAAAACADQAAKRVHKRGRRALRRSSPRTLHDLRIRCKQLRYLLELVQPVYGDRLRRSVKAVKRLQDCLGEHQDAIVAAERLRAYAESTPAVGDSAGTLHALRQLVRMQTRQAAAARQRFRKDWVRFERNVSRSRLHKILNSLPTDRQQPRAVRRV